MRRIAFVVGHDGAVEKYDPALHAPRKPAPPMNRHQRATLYFKAVRCVRQLFTEVGFKELTQVCPNAFTSELDGFILDVTVRESNSLRIAYVTSYAGYVYDPERINARVVQHRVGEHGEYVIQVGAVLSRTNKSCRPVFVVVDKDSPDPLRDAFMGVLNSAKQMLELDPKILAKIQEALAKRDLAGDFERFIKADEGRPALPEGS